MFEHLAKSLKKRRWKPSEPKVWLKNKRLSRCTVNK